jgi:tetratricopeptide (TPR) repeat protein
MRLLALVASAGLFMAPAALAQPKQPAPTESAMPRSTGAVPQSTLDDFIAGFHGDWDAMGRAIKDTDAILAKDPANAEALAWSASGKGALAGAAFSKGDIKTGIQLTKESTDGLNKSVELAPDNSSIRMVRGKSMLEFSIYDPNPARSSAMAETALGDLEKAVDILGETFGKSPKGYQQEIYAWLYQASTKSGNAQKAEKYKKLAGDKLGGALDQLNQAAEYSLSESARVALVILDSKLVQEIKTDLLAGLRSPAKLDEVVATLDKKIEAKPDDAAAMAWRGFARVLRTGSMFSQGHIDEATKAWTKGLSEINAAASTDATTRDAVLLRALSNLELARHSTDASKAEEARQKTTTDLDRFNRMLKDAGVTLTPQATAALQLTTARVQLMNGDPAKARAAVAAATTADPSEETAKRAKTYLQAADLLDKK